jgi:hypothetical protein
LFDCSLLLAKYLVLTPLLIKTIARIETDRDCSKRMVLVAIDLVEGFDFDARTFEFYLYQRQIH